jgi:hypothetical protein
MRNILLVPITSHFSHWDHHWFIWLPQHPVHESVEIASREPPDNARTLVWVFFTERAGAKHQVHYINQQPVASRWPGSLYRAMTYHRLGQVAQPQGVTIHFTDQEDRPVEVVVTVDTRPMTPGGLTDQSGHAAARHFLVFFREQRAAAVRNRVVIASEDFSFNGAPEPYRFTAAYSANVSTVILPFTITQFHAAHDQLASSAGHVFCQTSADAAGSVYVSHAHGEHNTVTLQLDPHGGLQTYTHQVDGYAFAIRFVPPLVLPPTERSGPVAYSMHLDHFPPLITGQVHMRSTGEQTVLEWRHEHPRWCQDYRFTSMITWEEEGGYQLAVSPQQTAGRLLTLMRPPVVKRQTLPKSGFCQFFPLWLSRAQSVPGNVFRLHFRRLVHQRRCTKHVLRFSRRCNDECRDRSEGSLRPRNISVPSYRPLQREG